MAYCPKCGNQVKEGFSFCNHCGSSIAADSADTQQPPVANIRRTPVKTDYSLVMFILLSIITCGIYSYYIIYKLAQDVNQMCAEDGDKIGGLVAYILLSFVTCGIYNIYWVYKIQNRMHAAAPRYNVMVSENGGTILMWWLISFFICSFCQYVAYYIIFKTANSIGMAYNKLYFY